MAMVMAMVMLRVVTVQQTHGHLPCKTRQKRKQGYTIELLVGSGWACLASPVGSRWLGQAGQPDQLPRPGKPASLASWPDLARLAGPG